MKNLILTSTILVGLSLVSCTSNQDLASLSEYDDVYYRSGDAVDAGKAPSSTEQAAAVMPGASSAEQSYYQNTPYAPSEPAQTQVAPNDDYYDADYARRVQNFHQNPDGNYNYGNSANSSYSSGPNVNVGMGYGNYGGNSSWGTSVGINYSSNMYNSYYTSPMYFNMVLGRYNYSNPWIYQSGFYYDPFYSPYYGFGSPYCGYGGYPYNYGYTNFYGYNPYYNYPVYGGVNYIDGGGSAYTNSPRANSTRPSRGGIVGNPSNLSAPNSLGNAQQVEEAEFRKTGSTARSETSKSTYEINRTISPVNQDSRSTIGQNDLRKPRAAQPNTIPNTENSFYRPINNPREAISPYARERNATSPGNNNGYQRTTPTEIPSYNRNTRSTGNDSYSNPTMNNPSYNNSPSRSTGGGNNSPSSPSPSRRR